ncbi:MAG: hypothetical protein ACQEUT_01720 [Bacillota bacterium]
MNKSDISIKLLCERLWSLENEYNLLNIDINGVMFWQLIRFKIFEELGQKLGLHKQAHTKKISAKEKVKVLPKVGFNAVLKSPMRGDYTRKILIFDHPRKIKINGRFIDIYTNFFIKKLEEKEYEIIESPYLWRHFTNPKDSSRKYTDAITLNVSLKRLFSKSTLKKSEINTLVELEKIILEKFNVKVELVNRTRKEVSRFKYQYNYYDRLIKKRNPIKIYMVVSYGREALVAAAKVNSVEVIEFQHGVITPYHFAYSFSHIDFGLNYFPDKILTFGEYWSSSVDLPKGTKTEELGFPYLNEQLQKYVGASKKKKQVLFLSQGTIGKELSILASEVAKSLPDYHFIYKLHPGEYARWKSEYPALLEAKEYDNFEVIDHNRKNLYSYFSESEFQLGVYSTALFEGLALNCKTILFNLPGIEYMGDLINQKIVEFANDEKEAIHCIKNCNTKEFHKNYFFKANK